MAVRQQRKVPTDGNRTVSLQKQVLEGYNQFSAGEDIPLVGKYVSSLLRKATDTVIVAVDFKAKEFQDFYTREIEAGLENYGRFFVQERRYATPSATVVGEEACRRVYDGNDPLGFGSYITFKSVDDTLEGRLSIGHAGDQELADSLREQSGLSMEDVWKKRLEWAKEKLKREGLKGAGDLAVATVFRSLLPPLAIIGLGDVARRIYNTAKIDAHWTLELNPVEGTKVTAEQFSAYRALVEKYRK